MFDYTHGLPSWLSHSRHCRVCRQYECQYGIIQFGNAEEKFLAKTVNPSEAKKSKLKQYFRVVKFCKSVRGKYRTSMPE